MHSRLLDESRGSRDKALQVFQYIKDTPLGDKIRVRSTSSNDTEEVKLMRRGRQSVRVIHDDGSETLVELSDVVLQ